jgi:hypothetical protein
MTTSVFLTLFLNMLGDQVRTKPYGSVGMTAVNPKTCGCPENGSLARPCEIMRHSWCTRMRSCWHNLETRAITVKTVHCCLRSLVKTANSHFWMTRHGATEASHQMGTATALCSAVCKWTGRASYSLPPFRHAHRKPDTHVSTFLALKRP